VCRIKKSLYILKEEPREWDYRIDGYLESIGFTKFEVDLNLYIIVVEEYQLTLVLYVDYLFRICA